MWPYVPWLEYGIWEYGHPIIIREEENENRNCKESNPVFNSWRQVPPHLWELNLCVCARGEPSTQSRMGLNLFFPALFAVRITEAATIHMAHMMLFVS